MAQNYQPYDSLLKMLFEGHAVEVLSYLLPEAKVGEELNDEVLKPPLRADRIYRARHQDQDCILHFELETKADNAIVYRLLEYNAILFKKYRKPVVSIIICPFRTMIPESPLSVKIGNEEILTFHYRVIALWKLNARHFLEKHAVSIYSLLPTMQDATYDVLKEAIDAMKEWHGEDRRRLAEHILLFDTFLRRSEMVSPEDKQRIEEELKMFDSLIEESSLVRRKAAQARAEGIEVGKSEGEVQALQQAIIEIVEARFPSLTEQAKHVVETVREPGALHMLIRKISTAPDENIARWLLDLPAA